MQGTAELDRMGAGLLEQLQRMEVRTKQPPRNHARPHGQDETRQERWLEAQTRRLVLETLSETTALAITPDLITSLCCTHL